MCKLVLASASPRRRQLLSDYGFTFTVRPAENEVNIPQGIPLDLAVIEVAVLKAVEVSAKCARDEIIISADTIVALGERIFGKPGDEAEARDMLKALSGKTHRVLTGFCCLRMRDAHLVASYEETLVTFRELSEEEIDAYIETGEPFDKAGAYGIQGGAGRFVAEVSGDYDNVVGLPVARLIQILQSEFDYRRD